MAAIAKQCFAFLLLAALFSGEIAARESQFFNKVPSNNADREIIAAAALANQDLEPTFVPENENGGYGLHGHNYKYNNGGSERAEEFNSKKKFNLYDNGNSYYNGQKQNSYNGGLEEAKFGDSLKYSSFESNNSGARKLGMSDTRFLENGKYFYDVNLENQKNKKNYNRPANKNNAHQGQDLP